MNSYSWIYRRDRGFFKCTAQNKIDNQYPDPPCAEDYYNDYFRIKKDLIEKESLIVNNNYSVQFSFNKYIIEININIKDRTYFTEFVNNFEKMLIEKSGNNETHIEYTKLFIQNLRNLGIKLFPTISGLGVGYKLFPYNTQIKFRFLTIYKSKLIKGFSTLNFQLYPDNSKNFSRHLNKDCNQGFSLAGQNVDGGYLEVLMNVFKQDAKDAKKNINENTEYKNIKNKIIEYQK